MSHFFNRNDATRELFENRFFNLCRCLRNAGAVEVFGAIELYITTKITY